MNDPSVFGVQDGDMVADRYSVPGTGLFLTLPPFSEHPRVTDASGRERESLSLDLLTTFRFREYSAATLHDMGRRLVERG